MATKKIRLEESNSNHKMLVEKVNLLENQLMNLQNKQDCMVHHIADIHDAVLEHINIASENDDYTIRIERKGIPVDLESIKATIKAIPLQH